MSNRDSIDDYKIHVEFVKETGIRVRLTTAVTGAQFVAEFGNLPASREKALGVAARLSEDLGCRVYNQLPRSSDIGQSKHYEPHIPLR